jgi:hypothetical protein
VKAFLNQIKSETNASPSPPPISKANNEDKRTKKTQQPTTSSAAMNNDDMMDTDQHGGAVFEESKVSVKVRTPQETRMIIKMAQSGEPKCVVPRLLSSLLPVPITSGTAAAGSGSSAITVSATQAAKVMQEHEKRLSKDFSSYTTSSSVLQNFRIQNASTVSSLTASAFKTTVSTSVIRPVGTTPLRAPMFTSVTNLNSAAIPNRTR